MAIVKLTDKDELDKLIASLTLRLGKKIPQQQVIDACIKLSIKHINELEAEFAEKKPLSIKQINEILEMADDLDFDTSKSIDEELYGG